MKDALVRRFGFQEERISVLTNLEATRDSILAAFEDLVRKVGENESVILHYSGHGSQKPDEEDDEPDGYDETLVPCDSGRAPRPNRDITDDEIHAWLQRLMVRTPYITLIIDCCNSGTILRERKVRGLPREKRKTPRQAAAARRKVFRDARVGSKPWLKDGEGEKCVLFAACHSAEFANEILVGDPPTVPHGALTHFLVQELMSPDFNGATCTEVFERLRPRLKGRCGDQNPQVEGARDRELFGQATILPMPFASVLARQDDRVTLEAGATSGLCRDSRWIVYAPGTRQVNDEAVRLGTLTIVSMGATTSEARVVEEVRPGAVIPGARAVEGFERLAVDLVVPPGHSAMEGLAIAVGHSNLLVRSYPGNRVDVQVSLRLDAPNGPAWAVTDFVGGSLGSELPYRDPGSLKKLVETLESMARLRRIAAVTNPGSALKDLIDLELLRWTPGGCVPPLQDERGRPLFQEGDRLVLEMRNRSDYPLHIYVLDIGLTGRVVLAYPSQGSQALLEAGQTFRAGVRAGEELTLSLPPAFDRLPEAIRREGRETLKLIVSTTTADLRLLLQPAQRYRSGPKEDWTTVEQSFRLLPRATA
jgi:hypothetical protein